MLEPEALESPPPVRACDPPIDLDHRRVRDTAVLSLSMQADKANKVDEVDELLSLFDAVVNVESPYSHLGVDPF